MAFSLCIQMIGGWRVWVAAARPPTLAAAIVPVLVGSAIPASRGDFVFGVFVAALVAAVLIQVGTNYANDLFDHLKGSDRPDRLGPPRATALGRVSPRAMGFATTLAFGLAVLVGLYLVAIGGLPILVVGVASIAAGIAYTAGPYPLGYHGLGDAFVFLFFGLVPVPAMDYLHLLASLEAEPALAPLGPQSGPVSAQAWWAAVSVGCVVTAILVVNNLRDIDQDRAVGKITSAVILGRTATKIWYSMLLVAAYTVPILGWAFGVLPLGALLPLLTTPLAIRLGDTVSHRAGRELNSALKGTAQLYLAYGALLALGLLIQL